MPDLGFSEVRELVPLPSPPGLLQGTKQGIESDSPDFTSYLTSQVLFFSLLTVKWELEYCNTCFIGSL